MSKEEPKKINPKNLTVPRPKEAPAPEQNGSGPPADRPPEDPPVTSLPEEPERPRNPLRRFSLRGNADELESVAARTKPLLGRFVMQGQATMIYAEPNAGKTLIVLKLCLDAIDGRTN
jgi:hypothetical protein